MDKKLKRERRQTGMTDKVQIALQRVKELKNSDKSRLQQAIEVRKNINILYRMVKLIIKQKQMKIIMKNLIKVLSLMNMAMQLIMIMMNMKMMMLKKFIWMDKS